MLLLLGLGCCFITDPGQEGPGQPVMSWGSPVICPDLGRMPACRRGRGEGEEEGGGGGEGWGEGRGGEGGGGGGRGREDTQTDAS